jgi:hypothetical protein
MPLSSLGKLFIAAGFLLVTMGVLLLIGGKIPFLGRLPGDFFIRKNNLQFYFPLTTCLLLSVLLSLFFRFFGRK